MPTAAERLVWGFGDGLMMSVINASLSWIGAFICLRQAFNLKLVGNLSYPSGGYQSS